MKQRIADYIADYLTERGIRDCFSVVGGGAMHLNDAFGHHPALSSHYHHHEQACAIAAEAYARLNNTPALVCVTSGPGGTNAITGVLGAWLDSIPMVVVSGQVRYDTTARYTAAHNGGLFPRAVGDQEYDVVRSVAPMTKFAAMLEDPQDVRKLLDTAWHKLTHGRPGPVWLDIPVNFQGAVIETDTLLPAADLPDTETPPPVTAETAQTVLDRIRAARRPVIYAGGGIRLSGGFDVFRRVADRLGVPVVTYWNSVDLIEDDHPLYCGRGGNMGDRAGNFAVQNADLVLAVGTRLSIRQVGYSWQTWARAAEVIMVDIDPAELHKHTIHVDLPILADARDFLEALERRIGEGTTPVSPAADWREQCRSWKAAYPVHLPRHRDQSKEKGANVFTFIDTLSSALPEGSLTAVSNGACCVVGHQSWHIKHGTRFIINSAVASMGYGLPAAIGLCIAGSGAPTVCLEGDGSVMMNLQELQTVVTNRLPLKIFLINNAGYHSIRQTQNNIFSEHKKVGIGPESGDLSFPDFSKIAAAFGLPYFSARHNGELAAAVSATLSSDGYAFCEIFCDTTQVWEPKSSARRLPDGRIVSPPLEDLAPFLPREELQKNMYIPLVPEQ